jgi:hypothetical protein
MMEETFESQRKPIPSVATKREVKELWSPVAGGPFSTVVGSMLVKGRASFDPDHDIYTLDPACLGWPRDPGRAAKYAVG